MKCFRGFTLILMVFLLAGGCSPSNSGCEAASKHFRFHENKVAPDFTLPLLKQETNQNLTLSEVSKDRPVLLVFWATWCPNCVAEIPTLNEWQKKYEPQGLQIVAVNVQEERPEVLQFVKKTPLQYPSVLDEEGKVANRYGLVGIPSSLFLAKGGEILYYGFNLPDNIERLVSQSENTVSLKGERL